MQTYVQKDQEPSEIFRISPVTDVQKTFKHSDLPTDDLLTKFEKTCVEYVTVLEEIADTFKTLDNDFLQNVLGMKTFDVYKRRNIER